VYSSTVSLTSLLVGAGWSAPRPVRFTPGKIGGTHCAGGRVGPRASLDCYGGNITILGGRCFMDLVGLLGYLFVCSFVRWLGVIRLLNYL
jgi:hypothetical protein